MFQICEPLEQVIKILGIQENKEIKYRTLKYVSTYEVAEGLLLYNHMTCELLLLNSEEALDFANFNINSDTVQILLNKWYFVAEDNDDYTLFMQTYAIRRLIDDNEKNPPLTNFIIYPTTDCNARCFYCFELGRSRINMTEQTAHDVADFIIRRSADKKVGIVWFGGEPLYNMSAMDTICQDLAKHGKEYESNITTNGYLFDENVIVKAKELWHLTSAQVTLDGTEQVYNRCKNFIYKDCPSPFLRVIDNIELLLRNDIAVNIRLNIDLHNCDDLCELTEQLQNRFEQYNNYIIYVALLHEDTGDLRPKTQDSRWELYEKYFYLQGKLFSKGISGKMGLENMRTTKKCMADHNFCTTILPDGNLGRCESLTEDHFYGSIYSDEVDVSVLEYFKEVCQRSENCPKCHLLPSCLVLKACPHMTMRCDEYDKKYYESIMKEYVFNTYNKYRDNEMKEENSDETKVQFCS